MSNSNKCPRGIDMQYVTGIGADLTTFFAATEEFLLRMSGEQGFGCMGFSAFYSSARQTTPDQARAVVHHALSKGVTLLNTATFYGELNEHGFGANLRLLKHCLEGVDRSSYRIMVKIGMDTRCPMEMTGKSWVMRGDRESLRRDVEYALEQLGTNYLDVIVLCRVPKDVPIETSVSAMAELVAEGKARHIGLSEAASSVIRRAHKVHPLYCVEQEWSLWSRDIEERIVPTCKELGIRIVAYSPLGRGFLTGAMRDRSAIQDFRAMTPKFQAGNFEANLSLVEAIEDLAALKGVTVGQLALAWLHAQAKDKEPDFVIPIPGTSSIAHLEQNLAARNVVLSDEELDAINQIFSRDAAQGERYAGNHNTFHEQEQEH